jgi:multiple sugar transport system ATP-binding protein
VAGFLGAPKMNFIAATVESAAPGVVRVRTAGGALVEAAVDGAGAAPGAPVTLGIRAEHLAVQAGCAAKDNLVEAQLRHVEYLGDQSVAYADLPGSEALVAARTAPGAALAPGTRLPLHLPAMHCHLFDSGGRAFARTIVESVL